MQYEQQIYQQREQLIKQVQNAYQQQAPLHICGGGSKSFLLEPLAIKKASVEEKIDLSRYTGIVNYRPSELTLTALAGTPLSEIKESLAGKGQMLAFEPPQFNSSATLGGAIACGLSGPRRPYSGAARDFVLGCQIINGKGELLNFGGEVMKNVAGYDLSRLMVGAYGTLGVILQVSLKVLPVPKQEQSLAIRCTDKAAFQYLQQWIRCGQPISAACYYEEQLHIRLSGADKSVSVAVQNIVDELANHATQQTITPQFWQQLNDQELDFFQDSQPLWRLSLPAAAAPISIAGQQLIDWGGALRWLKTDADSAEVRQEAQRLGGQAQLFRRVENGSIEQIQRHHPISEGLFKLQQRVKEAMDPKQILNPGYLFPQL